MLPGEIVDTTTGSLVILTPSPNRVEPRCAHFGDCGGCQYQHADYPIQLALKQQILEEILALAGLSGLPRISTHSAAEWEYRNRIRLRVQSSSAGIQLGYSRRATNEFLPISMCPIAAPLLWRAATALMELTDPAIRRWLSAVAEAELFCSGDEARLQILFLLSDAEIARREPAAFSQLCDSLRQQLPQLTGAGAILDPELNRRDRRKARRDGAAWGAEGLAYEAADRSYWVSRGAFFQVNRFLVDRLIALVTAPPLAVPPFVVIPEGNLLSPAPGILAWDLFAGVGLFTRVLADSFAQVVAVEAGEIAAANLASSAKSRPIEAVRATTLDFLRTRELQRERPDLIVLDPPRAGLGVEASEILARIAAPRIVYVSCDPTTLARDLAILTRSAYRVASIDLIDLFPQTFHMETVVHLNRCP